MSVEAVVSQMAHDGNAGSSVNQWLLRRSYEFSPAQDALIFHPKERAFPPGLILGSPRGGAFSFLMSRMILRSARISASGRHRSGGLLRSEQCLGRG